MATLYYNGSSFNNAANFFNDEAGTDPAGRVPTVGDTVYLVADSMPQDTAGDVLTCDVFYGSNPSTMSAFAWFDFTTFNCDVDSFNCYWSTGATINGVFTPTDLNPQTPTIGASGALDVSPIAFFMGYGYQLSDLFGTAIYGRVINWSSGTLYAATSDAVADPSDVRDGVFNLGVEGTLVASADYPAIGDVRAGVQFDSGNLTGTLALPAIGDVQSGVQFGAGGTEFTGTLWLPGIGDVRLSTPFGADGTEFTGTLALPAAADVRDGVVYDGVTAGLLDLPAEADVKVGVQYDGASKTGAAPTLSVEVSTP